jgi:hypothetical protein
MLIQAHDEDDVDLGSCVRRGRAIYESTGAASAIVLGARVPTAGHSHVELSTLDRRCLVIVNVGPTPAIPALPITLAQVAPAAPALQTAWPRAPRTCADHPRRRRAREKVLDMYVRSGLLAEDRMQARQTKRAKVSSERCPAVGSGFDGPRE